MISTEVAIIGGGPAGAVAAWILARAGRKVIFLDPCPISQQRKIGENLPSAAGILLRNIKLDHVLKNSHHRVSSGNGSVWGERNIYFRDSIYDPFGGGWILNRVKFDQDLRKEAVIAGAQHIHDAVNSVSRKENAWHVHTEKGWTIKSKWIVDTTGRTASISRRLGATRERDDSLVAIYSWVASLKSDDRSHTIIESTPTGWWYSAKLPEGERVISFHTHSNQARNIIRSLTEWEKELSQTHHIKELIQNADHLSELKCSEACGARLDLFAGKGWIAAGDAALSFDPLSSQGIFNALYTGMKAAMAVDQTLSGSRLALSEYSLRLENIRAVYLERRKIFYSMESRWQAQPFWSSAMGV